MVFHLHLVELIESKLRNALDQDCELTTKEMCLGLKVDLLLD